MIQQVNIKVTHYVSNEEMCRKAGIERELASRVDQRVLRWFVHRMDEYRMSRQVLMAEVSGGWYGVNQGLDGRCVEGLGKQRYDGAGCVTMCKR